VFLSSISHEEQASMVRFNYNPSGPKWLNGGGGWWWFYGGYVGTR